jgi:tetratricopeptide (TPR) repeat protein
VLSLPPARVSLGTRVGDGGIPDVEVGRIAEARKATDPAIKSDVAYKLAMEEMDLPDAQSLAEEAVKLQEERTVAFDVKKVDVDAFAQITLLSRYWNTLGWVYYRQGKLALAETYTKAAWDLDPQRYFGAHMGKIY